MKKFIVCDWYYPKVDINIDGIGTSFKEAKDILKADVENLLSDYGYQLLDWPDGDFEAVPGPDANCTDSVLLCVNSEDDIALEVNDEIICNWFIKAVNIPLTPTEKGDIYRELDHACLMDDISNFYDEHKDRYKDFISEDDFDTLAHWLKKSQDCDIAQAVFDEMYNIRICDEQFVAEKVIKALNKEWDIFISEDQKHILVSDSHSGANNLEDAEFYKFILDPEKCNLRETLNNEELYNAVIRLAENRGVRHEN